MHKTTRILRSSNIEKTYCYDSETYVKPMICNICKCKFNNKTWSRHKQTENHKLAVQLTSLSNKPIEDIKKTILEYKMLQKFQKRKLPDDNSSTTSTSTIEKNDSTSSKDNEKPKKDIKNMITIEKIRHKTEVYARELAHRAEQYEKTKGIEKLVCLIKNSTKRLTNLQKDKYYYLLNKYPQNEALLSIKHLVPPLAITLVKEPPKGRLVGDGINNKPKVKTLKKKQKQDITQSNNENVSYPIIKYEDKTSSNSENKSHPIIKYEDKTSSNSENKSYQIVKYEDKTSSIKKQQPAYEIVKYYQ